MGKLTMLNKKYTVNNGNVTIVETVEKVLSRDELQSEKIGLLNRQTQLLRQINDLKKQHSDLEMGIAELDKMLADIPIDDSNPV